MGRAAQKNRTIEAEKFVLRNASGKSRVKLRVWEGGAPILISFDKDGIVRFGPRRAYRRSESGASGLILYTEGKNRPES
ncbi:MAG: hypothetical protein KAR36_05310, partial [Candidatus Latescibacteria bacterium]|nr:hypothetical protein [Candidatus Latescibacterota bacterium]